jgi:hypothetical protein
MKNQHLPLLLITVFLSGVVASRAQVSIATWNFDGASPGTGGTILDTTGTVATINNATAVGATIGRLTPAITNLPPGGGSGTGLNYVAPYTTGTANNGILNSSGFGTSPSTSTYISFTITIGATIHPSVGLLEGISFDLSNAGTTGPRGFEVIYRIGNTGSFTSLGTTRTPNNTANNYGRFTFNLPTPTSLIANENVEFRFLGYSDAVGNSLRLDNVTFTATAIPEPRYYGLVTLLVAFGMAVKAAKKLHTLKTLC